MLFNYSQKQKDSSKYEIGKQNEKKFSITLKIIIVYKTKINNITVRLFLTNNKGFPLFQEKSIYNHQTAPSIP